MHSNANPEVEVFCARHPESVANAGGINLGNTAELTEKGQQQAVHIFERLAALNVEIIVASTASRTFGAVHKLARANGMECIGTDRFLEWRRPACTIGTRSSDPEMRETLDRRINEFGPGYVPHDGEETWEETVQLIENGLYFLRTLARDLGKRRIGLVGHCLRMQQIYCRILIGRCDPHLLPLLFRAMHARTGVPNGGIMHFWYGNEFRTNVRNWNVEIADATYLPEVLR